MSEITNAEVEDLWADHVNYCESQRPEWRLFRALYRSKMWKEGFPWGMDYDAMRKKLPFLVEGNKFQPWMSAMVASMFLRRPRASISLPSVLEARAGRPAAGVDTADSVRGLLDDWLYRSDVQAAARRAYTMALMYEASGFRIGVYDMDEADEDKPKRKKSKGKNDKPPRPDYLDRIWVESVPRWEMVLDRFAGQGAERFRGHVRFRQVEEVEDMIGEKLPQGITPIPLSDYLESGLAAAPVSTTHNRGSAYRGYPGYVRLLEFYDLGTNSPGSRAIQQFYVVEGTGPGSPRPIGKPEEIGWVYPNGTPACPLLPAVLLSDPENPNNGIPAAARVAQINVERNLAGSIVINAARRDAARVYLTKRGFLDSEAWKKISDGNDLDFIEHDAQEGVGRNIEPLPQIPLPTSLSSMFSVMQTFWQDAQGTADVQQGRQGKYLSAEETKLLAMYGERAAGELQAQMLGVLGQLGKMFLTVLRTELIEDGKKSLTVRSRGNTYEVTLEDLRKPWEVGIADAASTPVGDAGKKQELQTISGPLLELTKVAFGALGPDQQPPHPAVQAMAMQLLTYLTSLYVLPDGFSPSSIATTVNEAMGKAAKASAKAQTLASRLQGLQSPPGAAGPIPGQGPPGLPIPGSGPTAPPPGVDLGAGVPGGNDAGA